MSKAAIHPKGDNGQTDQGGGGKDNDKDTMPRDELKNGPIQNRGCTDFLCCLLFIVFFAGFAGVHWYGIQNGDPYLLLTTWDYDGNGCGYS